MAVKFGIRNYSRTGNQVTFTLVALNADGSIDTGFTGNFTWGLNNMTNPGLATFSAGDLGQRTYTTTIQDPNIRTGLAANFPGGPTGANLSVSGPSGTNVSFGNQGDHLLVGGAGNDTLSSNNGNDLLLLQQGGNDTVSGGAGNDGFYFGASYTAADVVNGGAGTQDQIGLQGNYAGGISLGSMLQTELLVLLPGDDTRFGDVAGNSYDYNITADANTLVSNNQLTIQANSLRAGEDFTFNGSASSVDILIYAGLGVDNLTGGSGNDGFLFGQGRFGASDVVNGGAGTVDQLGLQGNFSLTFGASQLSGLEFIVLLSASDSRFGFSGNAVSYALVMADGNVAAGQRMTISANTLLAGETLVFIGAQEVNGAFDIYSGGADDLIIASANSDVIFGGGGIDTIDGQGGADQMTGGAGNDVFRFGIGHSTASERDQILDFATSDKIDVRPTGSSAYTFIGNNAPTGQRQVQVIQNGNDATVNVYIDADATADVVIGVTVADGHLLTAADFLGVLAQNQVQLDTRDSVDSQMPGAWDGTSGLKSGLLVLSMSDQFEGAGDLHAVMPTADLLL